MDRVRRHLPRFFATVVTVSMLGAFLATVPTTPAAAAWAAPSFVRSIGGNGHAGVYAWGVQYNPVTNEVLVGDYLNFSIRRYTPQGDFIGDFWRPGAVGQPYSIAVDPRDGSIYVAELKDNPLTYAIAKYDKTGNFLFAFTPSPSPIFPLSYQVWMTVAPDGSLWVLDSHFWNDVNFFPPRVVTYSVNDATQTATVTQAFNVNPPGVTKTPRMYGIDVGNDGTVYISDAINSTVYEYTNTGGFIRNFGDQYLGQDNRGVAYNDATDRLYVVDAGQSNVDVFDKAGDHLFAFGSEGTGPGQFAGGGRQISLDSAGNVWIADFGNFRAEEFDANGNFIQAIPSPERRPAQGFFAEPRDVAVDPTSGDVWVADAWNQRFQRFSSGGQFLGTWGSRNLDPPYGMNYPRGIAIDPVSRRIWVSQERGHRIMVYNYSNVGFVGQVGVESNGDTASGDLGWPNDVEFYNGKAFIADRTSGLVKIFNSTPNLGVPAPGTFTELQAIPRANRGLAIDQATGNLYVVGTPSTSGSSGAIYRYVVNPSTGQYVQDTTFGGTKGFVGTYGSGDGQFLDTRDAVIINSVLYVSDDLQSRISAFDLNGNFLGKFGGQGTGAYQFNNCSGLATDSHGLLYVADAENDRITVFNPAVPRPATEGVRPTGVISTPANGATLPAAVVQLTGTAADNAGVGAAMIAVQDTSSGLWWNGHTSAWQSTPYYSIAALTGTLTNASWQWWFDGVVRGGQYKAQLRVVDTSNNLIATEPTRTFSISGGSPPPDTSPPDTFITVPVSGQQFQAGTVAVSGSSTDNVGVTGVQTSAQDTGSGLWWNGSSFSASSQTWFAASVASPGALSTTWSFSLPNMVTGSYAVSARGSDAATNIDLSPATAPFTVAPQGAPDTTPPDTSLAFPANNQTVTLGPLTINGGATDNVGVSSVQVAIKDRAANKWWNGSAWVTVFTWLNGASLGTPGGVSTTWSFTWTPAATGIYAVTVRAVDAAGNMDATRPWNNFTVN